MASKKKSARTKKGIAITVTIMGAIAAASFLVWAVPQETDQAVYVSDFENHLEGVRNIHEVLSAELDASFEMLQSGQISAEEYEEVAETTSTQINEQIIQLVRSQAPDEWIDSYVNYIEVLKAQNSIIRETVVAANSAGEAGRAGFDESLSRIAELRAEMERLVQASELSSP